MINNKNLDFYRGKRTRRHIIRSSKSYNANKFSYKKRVLGFIYLDAPEIFSIYNEETNESILHYINEVIETAKETPVMINFEHTTNITAAALLLLYAKLDNTIRKNEIKTIRIKFDTLKGRTKTAVMSSGIKDLLFKNNKDIDISNASLPIIKGTAKGEEFEQVIDHILCHTKLTDEQELILGAAISETVGNVKLHAYPKELGNQPIKPWWIICSLISDTLYLAIYDLGVGIPETILKNNWVKNVLQKTPTLLGLLTDKTDADLIKFSMIAGNTQTKEKKHGLGSQSIAKLIDETPDGDLWIFSNKGVYHKRNDKVTTRNTTSSIDGTLVQWNIKIK